MGNLFDSEKMAEGYCSYRPSLHPHFMEMARARLGIEEPLAVAVDIGCGAGLSAVALRRIAQLCVGLDPSEAMLRQGFDSPALFAAGGAEALPLRSGCADIVTAAGSLNWVDLSLFLPEAVRILKAGGSLVVYDYGPGRRFPESDRLAAWYAEFESRFPTPHCPEVSPETLQQVASELRILDHESFEIELTLTPEFYLGYVLTEINVAAAVEKGRALEDIRAWCTKSLAPVFRGVAQRVVFPCFIVYMRGPE